MIVRGVERAGGLPVFIPLGLPEATLHALYQRLDGLLFSGVGDVDPTLYNAAPDRRAVGVDAERDRTEVGLMRWAVSEHRPLFGICRGARVLNVALGGTLYLDLSEHSGALKHDYDGATEFALRPHAIQVEEDSRLARLVHPPVIMMNSLHHQAVREVAPGLTVTARAPDGVVEALEVAQHPFGLAVQWHPECLPEAAEMRSLFEGLVQAARGAPHAR